MCVVAVCVCGGCMCVGWLCVCGGCMCVWWLYVCGVAVYVGVGKKKRFLATSFTYIVPLRLQKAFGCTDAGTSVWSGFSGLDTIIVAITVFCECSSQSTKPFSSR